MSAFDPLRTLNANAMLPSNAVAHLSESAAVLVRRRE